MTIFDLVILLIIGFFGFKGFKNGLVKELGSLIALIAGIFLAIRLSDLLGLLIQDNKQIEVEYIPIISFAIIFIIVVVLVLAFAKILNQFVKLIKMQWLNKIAGVIFSIIKLTLILGGVFYLIVQFNKQIQIVDNVFFYKSLLFKPCINVFELLFPYLNHLNL